MLRRILALALFTGAAAMLASTADATPSRAGVVHAKPAAGWPAARATRIDGSIRMRLRNGILSAAARRGSMKRDGTIGVVLRFAAAPSPARLAELEAAGVRFTRREPTLSGAYVAHLDESGLAALEAAGDVARVSADELLHAPRPLDGSDVTGLREIGAVRTMQAFRAKDGKEIDGAGTVIGDLDSDVFVFHPSLFRADAGYHAFVDADGDGALTIGVDGVDLDGDGQLSDSEILRRMPQGHIGDDRATPHEWKDSEVSAARDFVYLDTNGNGRRDYGKKFGEAAPAYGEPVFVLDDANRDGKLSANEKLVQLGTSKLKGVLSEDGEHLRGDAKHPLIGYDAVAAATDGDDSSWQEAFMTAGHGTLSAGVLVGGQARGQELRGIAPGAELLVASSRGDVVAGLQWLVDHGANVLLTEFAPYVGVSLDGSSEIEAFLDAARAKGVLVVSPAGNLASSNRHAGLTLSAGSNVVPLAVGPGFRGAHGIYASFHHRSDGRAFAVRVRNGGGAWTTIPADGGSASVGDGITTALYENETARGTHEMHVMISSASPFSPTGGDPLPSTKWELDLVLDDGPQLRVDGYVTDDVMPWAGGIAFENGSSDRTICNPATADSAIRVAAYALADDSTVSKKGEIEGYSSRGPLLFDRGNMHLAAPTNVLAPVTPFAPGVAAWYSYGGTSGAGPHVAGAIALLRQAMPDASSDEIEKKLLEGVRSDAVVTKTGADAFGRGRLDVAGALGVSGAETAECGRELSAIVDGDGTAEATVRLDIAEQSGVRARWDLDYDGVPDTDWEPLAARSFAGSDTGEKWVRVDVLHADGCIASTTSRFTVGDGPTGDAPASKTSVTESGCACRLGSERAGGEPTAPHASAGLALAVAAALVRRRRARSAG